MGFVSCAFGGAKLAVCFWPHKHFFTQDGEVTARPTLTPTAGAHRCCWSGSGWRSEIGQGYGKSVRVSQSDVREYGGSCRRHPAVRLCTGGHRHRFPSSHLSLGMMTKTNIPQNVELIIVIISKRRSIKLQDSTLHFGVVVNVLCIHIKQPGGSCLAEALMSCDHAFVMMINVFCILSVHQHSSSPARAAASS